MLSLKVICLFLKKLNINLSKNSAILLLRIHPREMKTYVHTKISMKVSRGIFFTIIKKVETIHMSTKWWMNQQNVFYPYNDSALERKRLLAQAITRMSLKNTVVRETRCKRPPIVWFHLNEMSRRGKFIEKASQLVVLWGEGGNREWLKRGIRILSGVMEMV